MNFMSIILLIVGFLLLVKCADLFVDSCSNIAKSLGIPSLIIGLTIVAFGTSAPEAAVSVTASLSGMNDISIGNVVGSNICNLLLILGVSSFFGKLTTKSKIITRDFIYLIFSSLILFILSFTFFYPKGQEGVITRTNGLILLCFLAVYLYALITEALHSVSKKEKSTKFNIKDIFFTIVGIIGIILGGELVVNSATDIANYLNISQNVIALSIVAIGTSLPELVTSVIATKKGETDIAIGNVVGSNIFNILFILGLSSTISPITFGIEAFYDIIIMLIFSILIYLVLLKKRCLNYKNGIIFLSLYIGYMIYIMIR